MNTAAASRSTRSTVDADTGEILDAPRAMANAATGPSLGALIQVEQQRAIAEVQARSLMARANPRDPVKVLDLILLDCQRPRLAEAAAYQYARGGTDIRGPSIRLLEAIARRWGNLATGVRELSRGNGMSECQAFAIDLETGFFEERTFPVRHWRDKKDGSGYVLTDERDIYETVANAGARRKRSCLESIIPGDVVDQALAQCEATLRARADTSPAAMAKLVEAFAEYKVTRQQIEQRLQRRLDAITAAQLVGLRRIYASLRDGMSEAGDWFEPGSAASPPPAADAPPAVAPPAPEPRPRGRPKKAAGVPKAGADDGGPATVSDRAPGAAPGPAAGGPEPRPLADYQRAIAQASSEETATLVLDEARTAGLGADDLAALAATWRATWSPFSASGDGEGAVP
jgi:hypothetical protein